MKILHISDTHIHNLAYHSEYDAIFKQLELEISIIQPDIIVHTGDIVHQKVVLSPEAVDLTHDFLRIMHDTGRTRPVYILLGNHDGLVNNRRRKDAISPVVDMMREQGKNITILDHNADKNGHYYTKVADKEVVFGVFSAFTDYKNWPVNRMEGHAGAIHIALHHGMVGSETLNGGIIGDDGIILRHRSFLPLSTFKNYDYGFFGHVHEAQELDKNGRFIYAGSTTQTRFGESLPKGFWVWKDTQGFLTKEFVELKNPCPYCKVTIPEELDYDKIKSLADFKILPGSRVAMVVKNRNMTNAEAQKLLDRIRKEYDPIESSWRRNKQVLQSTNKNSVIESSGIDISNINSEEVQCDLIHEHLKKNFGITEEGILSKIETLHRKYYQEAKNVVKQEKPIGEWTLKALYWDNLFKYGPDNMIIFDHKLGSLSGIFGKNKSGKTSILDILSYALFNRTSKMGNKLARIVNTRQSEAGATAILEISGVNYKIERTIKRGKGGSSSSTVSFQRIDDNFNKLDELDANIIETMIGTFEDFLLSSYAAQFHFLKFVEDGPTDRLRVFKNLCDLTFFDDIVTKAKDEVKVIKKSIDKTNYQETINAIETKIVGLQDKKEKLELEKSSIRSRLETATDALIFAEADFRSIENTDLDGLDIGALKLGIEHIESDIIKTQNTIDSLKLKEQEYKDKSAEYAQKVSSFDQAFLNGKIQGLEEDKRLLQKTETKQKLLEQEIANDEKALEIARTVPCQDHETYPFECQYVLNAVSMAEQNAIKAETLERLVMDGVDFRAMIKEKEKFKAQLDEYNLVVFEWKAVGRELETVRTRIKDQETVLKQYQTQLVNLKEKLVRAEREKELIAQYGQKKALVFTNKQEVNKIQMEERSVQTQINSIVGEIAGLENNKKSTITAMEKQLQIRDDLEVHEKYLAAIDGKTGLQMEIIRRIIPHLNDVIANVLENMNDIQVFFDIDESDNLEIYLRDNQDDEPRTIVVGSGMEKQMAAVAIRMALLDITKMSHCDTVFLDEPATALDSDHLMEFSKVLELFKNKFSKVFLISHMDFLKDVVDISLDVIVDDNGYARISE